MNVVQNRIPRKPRKPVLRTVNLLAGPTPTMPGMVTIKVGQLVNDYYLTAVPADFGRGFHLEKFSTQCEPGEPDTYHVNLDGQRSTCECRGFLRWGHCKHVSGLQALTARGKL